MSKKRKTKKQKEKAFERRFQQAKYINHENITYTVPELPIKEKSKKEPQTNILAPYENMENLRADITTTAAASGIIIAVNILLFTLLSTGVLKLKFLGY